MGQMTNARDRRRHKAKATRKLLVWRWNKIFERYHARTIDIHSNVAFVMFATKRHRVSLDIETSAFTTIPMYTRARR